MTCRSHRARLSRYQDGDLSAADARALEEHARGCERCGRELRELRRVAALLDGLGAIEPSAGFTRGVLRAIAGRPVPAPTPPLRSTGLLLAGVGAVLSSLIVAGLAGWGPLDLAGWQAGLAAAATVTAKAGAGVVQAAEPAAWALLEGLAQPVGWLLAADLAALAAVLAAGRRVFRVSRLGLRVDGNGVAG